MKIVKFRGFSDARQKYLFGYYYKNRQGSYIKRSSISKANDVGEEVIPESVGQFVGLTDREGNEMYEGDIIKRFNYAYLIVWDEEVCSFKGQILARLDDFADIWAPLKDTSFHVTLISDQITTVIGNSFSSPIF